MIEASAYVKKSQDSEKDLLGFIKKFTDLKVGNGKEMREKLRELNFMKINEKHISKIIDLLPENSEELNKIFVDFGLDKDESQKVLEIVKQYK